MKWTTSWAIAASKVPSGNGRASAPARWTSTPGKAAATAAAEAPDDTPHTHQALLDALGFDPVSLDALMARAGWAAADLSAALLELELDGEVARLAGQLFQRRGQG